jgi:hypothetical protein
VDLILFNLGYLPKGDHSLHTTGEITVKAIKIGLHKIAKNGIIMLAAYPGTDAGAEKAEAVRRICRRCPRKTIVSITMAAIEPDTLSTATIYCTEKRVIMKRFRYTKIKEIVQSRPIETQEELAKALQEEGIEVTQATVSRDIKELMLIKVPTSDGHYRYALSQEQNMLMSKNRMARLFQDSIVRVDSCTEPDRHPHYAGFGQYGSCCYRPGKMGKCHRHHRWRRYHPDHYEQYRKRSQDYESHRNAHEGMMDDAPVTAYP